MSNDTILNSLVSAAGVIIVALIGVWTARLARKSAHASANVEERAKIVEGYDKLNEDLQKRNEILNGVVTRLEARVDEVEEKNITDRRRIGELEYDNDQMRRYLRQMYMYNTMLSDQAEQNGLMVPRHSPDLVEYLKELRQ